ncbi:MAG: 50S ribosomal protein L13 [Patescibacteria group bacterium]
MKKSPTRKVHRIDAADEVFGRLASRIAVLLRGKHKASFHPAEDRGDIVHVTNCAKIKFTGRKLDQKKYYRHSHYPGGLKETLLRTRFNVHPEELLRDAVLHMLPDNRTRSVLIRRLRIEK